MSEPRSGPGGSEFDSDYEVVGLRVGWGGTSVIAFVATLSLHVFSGVLGISLRQAMVGTLVLPVAGLGLGLIGLRFGHSRRASRAGVFLNAVVLLCIFVILPATTTILRWLG